MAVPMCTMPGVGGLTTPDAAEGIPVGQGSIRNDVEVESESEDFPLTPPPDGPPWPVEFLADLHAGLYPDDPELLGRVYADPDAVRVLAALEQVADDLRSLGRESRGEE
ncbi:hypothetical protein ACWF62_15050 [Rhodococcus sp. NPDC054953]